MVMAVGLLCGSLAGACFGFGVGLFVDVALLQTLGVSSLVLLAVGYGAGRLRERAIRRARSCRSPWARRRRSRSAWASRSCSSCSGSTRR